MDSLNSFFVRRACRLVLLVATLALPATVAMGEEASPSGEERATQARKDPRLVLALERLVRTPGGPPGVIVVIRRGNERTVYRAGFAELETDRQPRASEHLRIASLAKAFSGATALALVTDGALSLNDTIGKLLPDLPRKWHRVTLRQLLNHTSGLPDFGKSKAFAERVNAQPTNPPAPRKLLEYVADKPLEFPPGSEYRYSNSDNVAVGLMVEAVTGKRYVEVLRDEVVEPLRLGGTSLPRKVDLPVPYIHGYEANSDGGFTDVSEVIAFGGYAWASGGIVSTPNDLSRFVRAYVGGELFGAGPRAEQLRFIDGAKSSPPGPGRNAAGLALFRYRTRCGTVYGHTGSILGYTQFIAATRNGHRGLAFSVNSQLGEDIVPELRRVQELAVCVALGQ